MKFKTNSTVNVFCPDCDPPTKLVVKTNRHTGQQFLACPSWPRCEFSQPLTEDLRLTAAGARRLPGF